MLLNAYTKPAALSTAVTSQPVTSCRRRLVSPDAATSPPRRRHSDVAIQRSGDLEAPRSPGSTVGQQRARHRRVAASVRLRLSAAARTHRSGNGSRLASRSVAPAVVSRMAGSSRRLNTPPGPQPCRVPPPGARPPPARHTQGNGHLRATAGSEGEPGQITSQRLRQPRRKSSASSSRCRLSQHRALPGSFGGTPGRAADHPGPAPGDRQRSASYAASSPLDGWP